MIIIFIVTDRKRTYHINYKALVKLPKYLVRSSFALVNFTATSVTLMESVNSL